MNADKRNELGQYLEGRCELKEILGLSSEYLEQLRGRAQLFLDGGQDERALMMLGMLEELDRRDPLPSLLAAEVLLRQGRSDAALVAVEKVLTRDPQCAEALVTLAEIHLAAGEMVPAAATLSRVLANDPGGATAAGQRALTVAARGHASMMAH
jgi:predicted Zn-dependent protease